ncbi:MAG: TetR/AcrR family transcriptional regulator [Tepidiformaceae bacterium]
MLLAMGLGNATTDRGDHRPLDRRSRRRFETIEEILCIAIDIMTEQGVNGLTLAEVARRLGVKTPSIYKYFPSIGAVYDALFKRAASENLEVLRAAMGRGQRGLDALTVGLEASGRWVLQNQALAQLLFWRPVPRFEPSPEAFAPSEEIVSLQQEAIRDAVAAGQLGPEALKDAGFMVSILIKGVLTQAMANEPHLEWGQGRFTPTFPRLMKLLPAAYPPRASDYGAHEPPGGTNTSREQPTA